jgi:hypothetical protein
LKHKYLGNLDYIQQYRWLRDQSFTIAYVFVYYLIVIKTILNMSTT